MHRETLRATGKHPSLHHGGAAKLRQKGPADDTIDPTWPRRDVNLAMSVGLIRKKVNNLGKVVLKHDKAADGELNKVDRVPSLGKTRQRRVHHVVDEVRVNDNGWHSGSGSTKRQVRRSVPPHSEWPHEPLLNDRW